jgi:hypothetical protein
MVELVTHLLVLAMKEDPEDPVEVLHIKRQQGLGILHQHPHHKEIMVVQEVLVATDMVAVEEGGQAR